MSAARAPWYGAPVVWLGALILFFSIGGCIALILSATRYPDPSLLPAQDTILKVPPSRSSEPGS